MAEILENLGSGFLSIGAPLPLCVIAIGVATGIFVGAMPGLSPSMGVALLVPFTYSMSADLAVILLTAVYLAADYGGSITAVMINTPGTPAAAATVLDGYPLTQLGRPGVGLGVSLVASSVGGLIGTVVLMLFSEPLADFASRFNSQEYFAIAVFGLTSVASVGGKSALRALAMAAMGLLIATIGVDQIQTNVSRFSFGLSALDDGFSLIPILIGLFAISEVCVQIEKQNLSVVKSKNAASDWPSWSEYWRLKVTILRSSIIGTVIGIFPGAGATIASFVSYDVAKRLSKEPEKFGHGSEEGVAASEAANSSSVGGALVPLLTLGIPGSASTAVLIGALMIHDVIPGPDMIKDQSELVYGLFASLFVANLFLLLLGSFGSRVWIRVSAIPKPILFPLILAAAVVGSFAVRYSLFDVATCLSFGVVGWLLRSNDFPVVPIVLGMVLGSVIEDNLRRAVNATGFEGFLERPISLLILGLAAAIAVVPILQKWRHRKRTSNE